MLVSKFAAGLFDHPFTDEARARSLDTARGRALAREAAEQSMVLLINRRGTLPLDLRRTKHLALVGPLADAAADQCGSYFMAGADVVTVKQALQAAATEAGAAMTFHKGANAEDHKAPGT